MALTARRKALLFDNTDRSKAKGLLGEAEPLI